MVCIRTGNSFKGLLLRSEAVQDFLLQSQKNPSFFSIADTTTNIGKSEAVEI